MRGVLFYCIAYNISKYEFDILSIFVVFYTFEYLFIVQGSWLALAYHIVRFHC